MSKATHIIHGKGAGKLPFATMGSYSKVLEIQGRSPGSVISKLDVPGDPSSARPMSAADPTAGVDPKILADLAAIDAKNGGAGGGGQSQVDGGDALAFADAHLTQKRSQASDEQFDRVMASVRSAGLRSLSAREPHK